MLIDILVIFSLIITISVGAYYLITDSELKTIYGTSTSKSGSPPQTPILSNTSNTSNCLTQRNLATSNFMNCALQYMGYINMVRYTTLLDSAQQGTLLSNISSEHNLHSNLTVQSYLSNIVLYIRTATSNYTDYAVNRNYEMLFTIQQNESSISSNLGSNICNDSNNYTFISLMNNPNTANKGILIYRHMATWIDQNSNPPQSNYLSEIVSFTCGLTNASPFTDYTSNKDYAIFNR